MRFLRRPSDNPSKAETSDAATLQTPDERYRSIFENALDGMFVSTPAGRFVEVNPALITMLGYDSAEDLLAIDIPTQLYFDPAERERLQAAIDPVGFSYSQEVNLKKKNGEAITVNTTVWMVKDEDGNLCYEGIIRDITHQRRAEQESMELALQKERVAFLQEFIGNVSHDLKTPLSNIITNLYLLEKYADPEKQREKINVIREQTMLLDKYIHDMIAMSQLDHTPAVTVQPIKINRVLQEVQETLRPVAEQKHLTITLELDDSIGIIYGNHDQVRTLFTNLLENGLNYTTSGGVTARTRAQLNLIEVEVEDTGIGISESDLPRVFDRFYRAENARKASRGGTGLGLAIVKKIVELHDGKISVKSQLGVGTTFSLQFPSRLSAHL